MAKTAKSGEGLTLLGKLWRKTRGEHLARMFSLWVGDASLRKKQVRILTYYFILLAVKSQLMNGSRQPWCCYILLHPHYFSCFQ